jgi:L-ascorbate metabolism protein UlaG (beta-lactamase superfamily)
MKITRFFQSCLLIEDGEARILIDPSGHEADSIEKFGKLDAVFYTHEHSDHFEPELAEKFAGRGTTIYANASTAKLISGAQNEVKDGQEFDINGMKIKIIELPHCLMWDGSEGPQNTGYLINDKLFHPGDGKELANFSVENLALPITGPDLSLKDAFDFAKQVSAKNVLPIHYDALGAHPEFFKRIGDTHFSFKTYVLENGKSVEL